MSLAPTHPFDLVVVGTGFASSFFLRGYLAKAPRSARVLVLERGNRRPHAWQREQRRNADVDAAATFTNATPGKDWTFTVGFGGGSNCWTACTPRMLPADFEVRTRYGVSRDWPLGYVDLEPSYREAEEVMGVAGPGADDPSPAPRSSGCPLPPHRFSSADERLAAAYPGAYFAHPTARASVDTPSRPRCCGTGTCGICPIDAKFTVLNGMTSVYEDPRVEVRTGAHVTRLQLGADRCEGVEVRQGGRETTLEAGRVALGANALFNAHILLRSGERHPYLGTHLNEQCSLTFAVDLDGLEAMDGSTLISGHGYMLYDGEHRRRRAACLMESFNAPWALRLEEGRWSERVLLTFLFEDIPDPASRVELDPADPDRPRVRFAGRSAYTLRGLEHLRRHIGELVAPLPVERIHEWYQRRWRPRTQSHLQGTTMMSVDPAEGVVDPDLVHHRYRNLWVLGSGAFPSCPPANPTLTLSALSLRAAARAAS